MHANPAKDFPADLAGCLARLSILGPLQRREEGSNAVQRIHRQQCQFKSNIRGLFISSSSRSVWPG